MVKLEELEDEHFVEKPETTKDGALLADDDEDYTDTGMISMLLINLPAHLASAQSLAPLVVDNEAPCKPYPPISLRKSS